MTHARRLPALGGLSLLLFAHASPAMAEPIVTDRPDIAESSLAVGPGVYQLEQGTSYESGPSGSFSFPSLQRLGIGSNVELRLETPIVSLAGLQASFNELGIGAKWHFLAGEEGGLPSMGLIGHAVIDSQGRVEPVLKLAADTSLPMDLDLGMNLGTSLPPGSALPALNYAASVSRSLTDSLRCYAEVSGADDFTGRPELGVDGGLALLFDSTLQLDVAAYKGLTSAAADWYAGLGLSKRWGQ